MKKLLTLWLVFLITGLIILSFTGCVEKKDCLQSISSEDTPKIVTIDNCEYYEFPQSYGYKMYSHKGNCNNPLHQYK